MNEVNGARIKPIPYSSDICAKGWRFELDHERIKRSDTWALATSDIRPWLLMLWMTAWAEEPCGSLPNDDELIAAKIGMPIDMFQQNRARLMRGWWIAEDGRFYHDTLIQRVHEMLKLRDAERDRKRDYRIRKDAERSASGGENVPRLSRGTTTGQTVGHHRPSHGCPTGSDATRTRTSTSTSTSRREIPSVPIGTDAAEASSTPPAWHADDEGVGEYGAFPPSYGGPDADYGGLPSSIDAPLKRAPVEPEAGGQADPSEPPEMTAEERRRADAWSGAKDLLNQHGMPKKQTGTFIGRLVRDFGEDAALDVMEQAVVDRPANPDSWMTAMCQRVTGRRAGKMSTSHSGLGTEKNFNEGVGENGSF